jgi:RHS repeat-associated protein
VGRGRFAGGSALLSAETHRGNREATGQESYGRFLYNRFRYYSPEIGRYISADPIGQLGGVNIYAYAAGNPLSLFDPFGLDRYVVLVGQPGRGAHNVGNNFQRAADQQAADLTAAGHDVTVSSVGSVDDINNAITSGDKIDGGIIYYGHGWTGAIYPGQDPGPGTNVTSANASSLNASNLAPGATVTLNSCNAGTGGPNSIAQAIADALQASTSGYASPTGFSASPTGNAPSAPGSVPPATGPIYVRPARGGGPVSYSPR